MGKQIRITKAWVLACDLYIYIIVKELEGEYVLQIVCAVVFFFFNLATNALNRVGSYRS